MKKQYEQPTLWVVRVETQAMLAISGNFTEGETIDVGIHDDMPPIGGSDAWSPLQSPMDIILK